MYGGWHIRVRLEPSKIPAPRKGESFAFALYPDSSWESTVGDPEAVVWSSIRHYCSQRAAEFYLHRTYGIARKKLRGDVAWNVGLYIRQAFEFYEAAARAKPNTAPLIYYYSFLNMAKALCEIHNPRLNLKPECYSHGLAWRPHPRRVVNFAKESVKVRGRGVWHLLWETLMQKPCPATDATKLRVSSLFSFCQEISAEYRSIFGDPRSLLYLDELSICRDRKLHLVWLRFSVGRPRLKECGCTGPRIIEQIKTTRSTYVEVAAGSEGFRAFESATPGQLTSGQVPHSVLHEDLAKLNLFTHFSEDSEIRYAIPLQARLPLPMPQIIVSYTILFWLASLVRYDPHSVDALMNSEYWILIDGFMTQSRIWLLELFRWALYQKEITLRSAR